jgi:GGDEF domain-containing protein
VRSAIRRAGPVGKRSALRMSVGAATARKDESLAETVTRADRAMYVSKKRRARQRTT